MLSNQQQLLNNQLQKIYAGEESNPDQMLHSLMVDFVENERWNHFSHDTTDWQ